MSTATLTWTDPTTRTDGTPLAPSDIAGVDIYDTGTGTYLTGLLAVGQHTFTVVVRDTSGHSSAIVQCCDRHGTADAGESDCGCRFGRDAEPLEAPPSAVTNLAAALTP
jgi:hypothetical protein